MKTDKRVDLGKRIQSLVHKSTGQNEVADSALINQDILPDILSPNFSSGSLYADCKIINVGDNKNGIKIPVANESTRTKTSVRGGFRAYIISEGVAKTASKGSFGLLDLVLKKEAVVIPCTDELLQDSEAIATYINDSAEEALMALTDDSIIHGNGLLEGIDSHPSTGFVSLSDPITQAELHNFFDAYYGGVNGKWYLSKVRFGQIIDLYESDAIGGGSIVLTATEGKYYLFGYPMVICDTMADNEILLADLSQYVIAQKEMTKAVNQSLLWLEDEQYFRFVIRIAGTGLWTGPITLADGSVVYPFVMSTGMEVSSSSESSESSESNSSGSSGSSGSSQSLSSVSSQSSASSGSTGSSQSSQSLSSASSQSSASSGSTGSSQSSQSLSSASSGSTDSSESTNSSSSSIDDH